MPYEISERLTATGLIQSLIDHGLITIDGTVETSDIHMDEFWRRNYPLPHVAMLLAFTCTEPDGNEFSMVQQMYEDTKGVVFVSYVKGPSDWISPSVCFRIIDGAAYHMNTSDEVPIDVSNGTGFQTFGTLAMMYLIYLMHHQAIDYEMASLSPGQRRYNASLHRKQPPIPRPRVLDLSKPKLERIPVYVPRDPVPSGRVMPGHDRRKHQRTFFHPRYKNMVGKTIEVAPAKIHGGATQPRLTLVRLPKDA